MSESSQLLTIEQLSSLLHKGVKTLRNWRHLKPPKGPRWIKIGCTVMYRMEDVEEYLKKGGDR